MVLFRRGTIVIALVLFTAGAAEAQLSSAPADSLRGLLRDAMGPLGSPQTVSTLVTLSSLEVSTAPLGTSTGGFTFSYDPMLKTFRRATQSFGPAFGQRSLTTGRAKFSLGANWLHARYDSLGGFDLRDGSFVIAKNIQAPALQFTGTSASLDMSSDTLVAFGQVGVTDDLDVGLAVPWIRVSVSFDGAYLSGTGRIPSPPAPVVSLPQTIRSGLGDVAVYMKYRLVKYGTDGGLAGAVEVRLPTGDKNNLRGLDITRTLVSAIWSSGGRVSPHASVGYELWSADVPITADLTVAAKNQFKYSAGVELDASPQLTVLVDFVGRRLMKAGQIGYQRFTVPGGTGDLLVGLSEGVDVVAIAPGVKWNVWRNLLISANVLGTLSEGGLRAKWVPVVGFDLAF